MPCPTPRALPLGLPGLLSLGLAVAAEAQSPMDCLLPLPPRPLTDAAVAAEYAPEIREEYAVYFDEAQAFFRCIDQLRAAVSEEVNQAIVDYGALRPVPPD